MNHNDIQGLARTIRLQREKLGISASELARRARVAKGTITRLELGQNAAPRMDNLLAIAEALELPLTELLAESDLLQKDDLPAFSPYLRTKYKGIPESALKEIDEHFREVAKRHGIHLNNGPAPGEDE